MSTTGTAALVKGSRKGVAPPAGVDLEDVAGAEVEHGRDRAEGSPPSVSTRRPTRSAW